ncbi:hypothetical protein BWI93_10095 [Siphonobacter sp. BAB-5385]|uniref:helix-turn-helix domain-containing protein n=1 Tax=Siphonobacter sp. BAB-5385 TaxID=1864822 RepID=UPI000B9E8417|nr:helix-turn-helix transcriptional regulator [Siphonobacter sp. BAB-5385]OZI08210.1 hypothetical protein BWI93_10095 [Siphonobacter sp. BAB-5385]
MKNIHNFHTGLIIKGLTEKKRISAQALADQIGMTRSGVYDVFKRQTITDLSLLEKISAVLDVPITELHSNPNEHSSKSQAAFGEDIADKFERIFQEWKAENEFLKEQIKEKDKLITQLMGKSEGCPIIADLELSLIKKIEMVYHNGLIFLSGGHKFGHTPTYP